MERIPGDRPEPADPAATLQLVQKVQQGEAGADDALARRVGGRLLAMIMLRMGPHLRRRRDPEDVLQEVWLEIFRSLPGFDAARGVPFGGWAATIVRRTLDRLHEYDRARPEPETPPQGGAEAEAPPLERAAAISSPSLRAYRREAIEELVAAVEALPVEQREVVASYWFEELPAAEIAARTGRSRQAVYVMISRANRWLAQRLHPGGDSLPASWLEAPATPP